VWNRSIPNEAIVTRSQCLNRSDDPSATPRGLDGAILEKGNRRITRHLCKRAVHRARQTRGRKREEKVRGPLRERCRAFIDGMDAFEAACERPESSVMRRYP